MARQKNDGKGRIGGREKGTPNKVTASLKEWMAALVDKNRKQIEKDLKALTPAERVKVLAGFLPYLIPKQQAIEARIDDVRPDVDGPPVIVFAEPKSELPTNKD